jgi:hypothetical protein
VARLGSAQVLLVDLSLLGARVEHHVALAAGGRATLSFRFEEADVVTACRIVRSRLERFSVGTDGLTVYHTGLEFEPLAPETRARLKAIIGDFLTRAMEEQKLNARGVLPEHDPQKMPIFRFGGQLTADAKDKELAAPACLPVARVAKETGYVCYQLERNQWRRKRTHDPGQPPDGFTISAAEELAQAEMLCKAYESADENGRKLIQLCAQMSIADAEGPSSVQA